jgi:hypothetical protein
MALANTTQAIGAVTRLLVDHLNRRTSLPVNVGRPEDSSGVTTTTLNLFLYETIFDPSLKNHALSEGQRPPLWLTLKYLLTGFDDSGNSDRPDSHDALGMGLSALQELAFLGLDTLVDLSVRRALEDNPEQLKITFDDCTVDLVNKITQASDDEYRLSVAFQVRPVMIVPPEPPSFSLLVGIDYTITPVALSADPVGLDVLASLGPRITAVSPGKFSIGDQFEISGEDLHLTNLECWLGAAELGIMAQHTDRLSVRVENSLQSGTILSAGEHPLVLKQFLPDSRRYRNSNLLIAALLPTLTSVVAGAFTADLAGFLSGTLTLDGFLLGRSEDAILIALYQNGAVANLFDIVKTAPNPGDPPDVQQQLVLAISTAARVRAGTYQVMVVVNGQQARQSPGITLAP